MRSDGDSGELPLAGIRVVEFSHMVMGPSTGVIMADLGAEVIKVEPIGGDQTRRLLGSGAGYYPMFNRNKRSVAVDLKSDEGLRVAIDLIMDSDVLIENFRPGALEKLGLGPARFTECHPELIYYSAKGFLSGPYQDRSALDEVAQMMGGLAYMTGPPGRPLRAGASVIDITGGMFGVIGILSALLRRAHTGKGSVVRTSLFETTAFLVGQHMAQMAVTGVAARPMPERISAWAIYDVFETSTPGEQVFIGVVSDPQWKAFTKEFDLPGFSNDPALETNNERVNARDRLLPVVAQLVSTYAREELVEKLERAGVAFAPIARPEDLFEDRHLNANGGLVDLNLPDHGPIRLPALPIEIDGRLPRVRRDLSGVGVDTQAVLRELGYDDNRIQSLSAQNVIGCAERPGEVI